CAAMLKPHDAPGASRLGGGAAGRFFSRFNSWFGRTTDRYQRQVGTMLGRPLRWLAVFAVLVLATWLMFQRLPGSFLPTEDQGAVIAAIQAPPGATMERTSLAVEQVKGFFASEEIVENTIVVNGFSFFGQGQAHAISFVRLTPWDE